MKRSIIKFSIILLAGQLFNWWLLFYSPIEIPAYIPGTPINIPGLLLIALQVTILIFFQKQVLKLNNKHTIIELTLLGALVCFISECIFQIIRFPTIQANTYKEKIYYAYRGIIVIPLFALFISTIIATILKKKRL